MSTVQYVLHRPIRFRALTGGNTVCKPGWIFGHACRRVSLAKGPVLKGSVCATAMIISGTESPVCNHNFSLITLRGLKTSEPGLKPIVVSGFANTVVLIHNSNLTNAGPPSPPCLQYHQKQQLLRQTSDKLVWVVNVGSVCSNHKLKLLANLDTTISFNPSSALSIPAVLE